MLLGVPQHETALHFRYRAEGFQPSGGILGAHEKSRPGRRLSVRISADTYIATSNGIVKTCEVSPNQLRRANAQPLLICNERLPFAHHSGRTVSASADPALVVADKHAAGKRSVAVLGVGFAQRNRAIGSTTDVLGQPLCQAQDRIARIDRTPYARVSNGITTLSGFRHRIAAANRTATSTQRIFVDAPRPQCH